LYFLNVEFVHCGLAAVRSDNVEGYLVVWDSMMAHDLDGCSVWGPVVLAGPKEVT
jgi:hypothetical protein